MVALPLLSTGVDVNVTIDPICSGTFSVLVKSRAPVPVVAVKLPTYLAPSPAPDGSQTEFAYTSIVSVA